MSYLPQVVAACHISGFIVSTRFDDGIEKQIDVSQWFKGPVFESLKDPKVFKKFFIEGGDARLAERRRHSSRSLVRGCGFEEKA